MVLQAFRVRAFGKESARMAALPFLPAAWLSDCDAVCDVTCVMSLGEPSRQAFVSNPITVLLFWCVAVDTTAPDLPMERDGKYGVVAAGAHVTYCGCRGTRCVRKAVASIW